MFDIYHDVQIDAPAAKVFNAIANPDLMVYWWPLRCTGEMKLGGNYNFFFTPEYNWYGIVTRYEKDIAFQVKMTDSDADWNSTTFGYDLVEVDEGTRIEFYHKNWPERNHHHRRSSFCWALLLKGLKDYVERGVVIPFENRS